MSLWMRVVIGKEKNWSIGVLQWCECVRSHYSITPLPALKAQREILANSQLRILGKEDFGNKDFVWCELARRDCFAVFDSLLRIDQDRGGFFGDSVVVGPFCQEVPCGIHQVNFDPMVRRKVERHRTLGQI